MFNNRLFVWNKKIWVYKEKHCHVISTSHLCCIMYLKKNIDILPQWLYPTMVCFQLTVHVHRGVAGALLVVVTEKLRLREAPP